MNTDEQPKKSFAERMRERADQLEAARQAKYHPVVIPTGALETGQLVRVYRGKQMQKDFERELAVLAKDGWRVQSQAYGGQRGPGVGKVLAFGIFAFAGGRKSSEMTVVYNRD